MKSYLFQIVILIGLLAAYAPAQSTPAGKQWKMNYLRGVELGPVSPYVSFDKKGSRFTGSTGCNIMNGSATMHGRSIKINTTITTKRACTTITGPIEGGVLSALGEVDRFQVSTNRLRLYHGRRLLMEFEPMAAPVLDDGSGPPSDESTLADRKWVLREIAGSDIPKVEELAFINFDPRKGSAGGDTSCNAFGSNYETKGDRISITQTISTMRACIEDERMNIERGFLDGLRETNRYEIRGNVLTLYHDRKVLLKFEGRQRGQ